MINYDFLSKNRANNDNKPDQSDNSDGETEEGDYTVYECPGLAPVNKNLFAFETKSAWTVKIRFTD